MKMIWAIIRSESVQSAIDALRRVGIEGITRMNVINVLDPDTGCNDKPPAADSTAEEMIMVVLADHKVGKAIGAIRAVLKTGKNGQPVLPGHATGRILITYVEEFFTIRPSRKMSGPQ